MPNLIQKVDTYFSAKPYSSPYISNGLDILDNFYVEFASSNTAKVKYNYIGIQGLHLLLPSTAPTPCRGMISTSSGRTFGVWGSNFVEIGENGTVRTLRNADAPLRTYQGVVRFAENGYQVIMVDGNYGYIYDLTSNRFSQITDQYFPGVADNDPTKGPTHVVNIDTYFIVNSAGTNNFYWSSPGYIPYAFDFMQPGVTNLWNGLQYGSKIGDTDNITAMAAMGRLLVVAGRSSMEFQFNAAGTDPMAALGQLFQRVTNALVGVGVAAPDTLVSFGNNVYWLGRDRNGTVGVFTVGTDFQPKRISERGLEARIQAYESYTDAYAFAYAIDGHQYINFVFPSGTSIDGGNKNGATWCYDITTETCTRRTKWIAAEGQPYRYQGEFSTENFSMLLIGDNATDAVYYLDSRKYDNDLPDGSGVQEIQGRFSSPISANNGKNTIFHEVQLNHQPGFAPQTGYGSNPKIGLQISNDTGVTFGRSVFASLGVQGQYAYRTRWLKCGISRNRVHLWTVTDPVRRVINGYTISFETCSR